MRATSALCLVTFLVGAIPSRADDGFSFRVDPTSAPRPPRLTSLHRPTPPSSVMCDRSAACATPSARGCCFWPTSRPAPPSSPSISSAPPPLSSSASRRLLGSGRHPARKHPRRHLAQPFRTGVVGGKRLEPTGRREDFRRRGQGREGVAPSLPWLRRRPHRLQHQPAKGHQWPRRGPPQPRRAVRPPRQGAPARRRPLAGTAGRPDARRLPSVRLHMETA